MPAKPPAPSEPADYRRWKSHAAALLERQGILPGVMRERDWRQLYIRGKTAEDAAREAEAAYYNTRPPMRGCKAMTRRLAAARKKRAPTVMSRRGSGNAFAIAGWTKGNRGCEGPSRLMCTDNVRAAMRFPQTLERRRD
jgi:hypothetical protein